MAMIESFGDGVQTHRLRIKGYIKIGQKSGIRRSRKPGGGLFRTPEMLQHFRVTLAEREQPDSGVEGNLVEDAALTAALVAKHGAPLSRIDVMLPGSFQDVYSDSFVAYAGQSEVCRGLGREATWVGSDRMPKPPRGVQVLESDVLAGGGRVGQRVRCAGIHCPAYRPTVANGLSVQRGESTSDLVRCRVQATLIVGIVEDQSLGAYHQFTTHGLATAQYLRGSLLELYAEAERRGIQMWQVPLVLRCGQKRVVVPATGQQKDVTVVWLEFAGDRLALAEAAVAQQRRLLAATSALVALPSPHAGVSVRDLQPPPPSLAVGASDDYDPETGEVYDAEADVEADADVVGDASVEPEDGPVDCAAVEAEAEPRANDGADGAVSESGQQPDAAARVAPKPRSSKAANDEMAPDGKPAGDVERAVAAVWTAVGGRSEATTPRVYEAVRASLKDGQNFPAWGDEPIDDNDVDDLVGKLYIENRGALRESIKAVRAAVAEAA